MLGELSRAVLMEVNILDRHGWVGGTILEQCEWSRTKIEVGEQIGLKGGRMV